MKIHTGIEQGSDVWKALRAGRITASRAKDARDFLKGGAPSAKQKAYAAQVAVERIAGVPLDMVFETAQMREGRALEAEARRMYEVQTGYVVEEVTAISTDDDVFLYSPDGLVEADGLLEVKCLFSPERILAILAGGDISDFRDQGLFGLWSSNRKWIDYMLRCPALDCVGMGHRIIRLDRNEAEIEALEEAMLKFKAVVDSHIDLIRGNPLYCEPAAAGVEEA